MFEKTRSILQNYLEDTPRILSPPKFVQVIVLRQTNDFSVFRTEASRELNTVLTPRSVSDHDPTLRVAFFGSKQKAVETRAFAAAFKEIKRSSGLDETALGKLLEELNIESPSASEANSKIEGCRLKDNLCLMCPRCILFGGITVEKGEREASLKHRIGYSTAYSLESYEEIATSITFNAVYEEAETTGQALGTVYSVDPVANFPSISTLRAPTINELMMYLKVLDTTAEYGAETRVRGRVRNHVIGLAAGMQELLTPLELTLELAEKRREFEKSPEEIAKMTHEILKKYTRYASFGSSAKILSADELAVVLQEAWETVLTREFVSSCLLGSLRFFKEAREALQRIGRVGA